MVAVFGCVVVLMTAIALMLPALSMTRGDLVCSLEEHAHSASCYEKVLVCGMEEGEGADPETGEGGHAHTKDCYEKKLVCEIPEHKHSDACYEQVEDEDEGSSGAASDGSAADSDGGEGTEGTEGASSGSDAGAGSANDSDGGQAAGDGEPSGSASSVGAVEAGAGSDMPAQSFKADLKDAKGKVTLTVEVEAPEGAFPAGTFMKIDGVDAADIEGAVEKAVAKKADGKVTQIQAVDIAFHEGGAEGKEIEPACDITVKLTSKLIAENEKPLVVHVDDKGKADVVDTLTKKQLKKRDLKAKDDQLLFDSDKFSTYGIVITSLEQTLTASDGNAYKVTVTCPPEAGIPADAELQVGEFAESDHTWANYVDRISEELGSDVEHVRLFDINIMYNGEKIQPQSLVEVKVSLDNADELGDNVKAIHFTNREDLEVLNATRVGETISFETPGFSVYAIVGANENAHQARVKYVFQNADGSEYEFENSAGNRTDNQIIKNGEILENVGIPTINADSQTFNGWFIYDISTGNLTGEQIMFDKAISISTNAQATSVTGSSVQIALEDNNAIEDGSIPDYTIYVRPHFGDVAYITFWNEVDGKVVYTKIQVPKGTTYNIANQSAVPPDAIVTTDPVTGEQIVTPVSYAFTGWSTESGTLETGGSPDSRTPITNTVVTVNNDTEFYPIFRLSHWVNFNSAPVGSGATYYPPVYILSGETAASARPSSAPIWEGHTFVGWFDTEDDDYLSVGETASGAWDFNQTLDDDVTLYAHWNAGTANVTIIRWLQQVTDDKNYTDAQKNYEYGGQVNQTVAVNSTVAPEDFDDPEGFMINSTKSDSSVVVQPDGTSVLNVYYDRKLMTMVFSGLGNQQGTYYTETDGNSGTQYGYVNGQYVQLAQGAAQTEYYWTYSYWGSNITYTGTFYTRSGRWPNYTYTPTEYNGSHLPDSGTYYGLTSSDYWGNPEYSQLTRRSSTKYLWTYEDSNGVTQTYTGPRYTRTTTNNTTVYTGLYGQTLEQNSYSWPSGTWQYSSGNGTYGMSYLGQFVLPIDGSTIIFSRTGTNTKKIRFYLQNVDGTYPNTPSDTGYVENSNNSTFYFSEKYDGFTVRQYRLGNGNWQTAAVDGSVSYGSNTILHIRYERLKYNVKYLDSRNGTELPELTTKSMVYGADLSAANPNVSTLTPPTPQYEWDGHWYTDQDCTTIALFSDDTSRDGELGNYTSIDTTAKTVTYGTGASAKTYNYQPLGTMPNHDISVYAGWNEIWYWIKVDPNGGVLTDTESTWFWKTLGDKIDEYHDVTRQFVEDPNGTWYYHYDELNPETELNQYGTNERKAYYTQDASLSSDGGKTYSQDPKAYSLVGWYEVDQETGQLKGLYDFNGGVTDNTIIRAVWRTVGEYTVKYSTEAVDFDGNPETDLDGNRVVLQDGSVPIDASNYADKSNSSVGNAPTFVPEGYTFVGWYYDGAIYNPGDAFMVKAELADDDKQVWMYPVVVRYEQLPVRTTHIHWYANYQDKSRNQINEQTADNQPVDTETNDPLQINESVDIMDIDTLLNGSTGYAGYTFLGWAKSQDAREPWLKLESDGTYSMKDGTSTITGITKIAADENEPYDDLYAVWERKSYTVTVKKIVDSGIATDQNKPFVFEPSFSASGLPPEYQANFSLTGENTTIIPEGGSEITYNAEKTFENIPYGSTFSITEGNYSDFDIKSVTYTVTGADDESKNVENQDCTNGERITVNGNVTVTFANARKLVNIKILKTDDDEVNPTALDGASFKLLYKTTDGAEEIATHYADGEWELVGDVDSPHAFTVPENGLEIANLPIGEYRLVELSAPAGYVFDEDETLFDVALNSDGETIVNVRECNHAHGNINDSSMVVIENRAGHALPTTGGVGTIAFNVIGVLVMIVGVGVLLRSRRRAPFYRGWT